MMMRTSTAASAATLRPMRLPQLSRNAVIVSSVVLFHVAALWALQSGLIRRAVEVIVPVALLSQVITPPAPKADPPPAPKPVEPAREPVARKTAPQPAPLPVARLDAPTAPQAPLGSTQPQPALPPAAAPVAAAPTQPAAPAPAKVELPSSDADYLQNPKASYPRLSKKLGEQGTVVVRVHIGADGTPLKAELKKSSGFERLDQSALEYVMKCRYVAGKINGVPQAMWKDAPVAFVLE